MLTDEFYVEKVKQGNLGAFSELVQRHQKVLLRLAMRITRDLEVAEDVVQDSFVKAFRKIDSFEGRSSFKSWVYQITANTAKNKLRKMKRETISVEDVRVAVQPKVEKVVIRKNLHGLLQSAISQLPPKQQMAIHLRVFDEMSFKEISEIMSCPYDTAKANYRHALMKLRHKFDEDENLRSYMEVFNEVKPEIRGCAGEAD